MLPAPSFQASGSIPYQTVGEQGQRLVVVNLQTTPLDHLCALRIFAKTDQVRQRLWWPLSMAS